jgi:ligand-binding sensor domain-containing protein
LRLHILFLLLFFFVASGVNGQPNQIQFSSIDLQDGLSHNQVNAIKKDAKGFLWFGTFSGLNRYDGYAIKVFKHDPRNPTSISNDFITDIFELPDHRLYIETRSGPNVYNGLKETFSRDVKAYLKGLNIEAKTIRDILKDDEGNFWFNAVDEGIFKYEVSTRKTIHLKCDGKRNGSLGKAPVSAMQKGPKGEIWVIHQDKTIELLDGKTGKVRQRLVVFQKMKTTEYQDFKMFLDKQGDFWIYTLNNQRGIDYYAPATGVKRFIDKGVMRLNNNLINGILQDNNGLIWIATDHGGVNLLNKRDFSIRYLVNREDDQKSIGQNSITSIYKDTSGIIWIGTFKKGISYYHEKILKFPLYRHQGTNPNGLTYDDLNRFVEDDQGNLWIGTNGGGLFYFNRKTGQFKRYRHEASNANSISNDIIVSLYIDKQRTLWIGTYFGGLDSFDGKQFRHYKHQPEDPKSLADDRVWDILEDAKWRSGSYGSGNRRISSL